MRRSMTYGTMPSREEFDAAFEAECPHGEYGITLGAGVSGKLGPHFGDGQYTSDMLWLEIERVMDDPQLTKGFGNGDSMLEFVGCVLETLGFEWI